jgi:hypothetical protein
VATAVNGIPDLVEPGATGLLAGAGDVGALATCVRWMLDNPAAARAMGLAGRERVRAGFAPEQMCSAVEACYRDQLGLPAPAVVPAPTGRHVMVVPAARTSYRTPISTAVAGGR